MNRARMRLLAGLAATSCAGALAVIAGQAAGAGSGVAEYYVSITSGVDADGYGTAPNHAFATIGYAAGHLKRGSAGAIVHVAPGTYTSVVENDTSGQPGAYLTFISDEPQGAKIVTDSQDSNEFPFRNRGDYVKIVGFEVSEQPTGKSPEGIVTFGSHTIIEGNKVHDIDPPCHGDRGGDGIGTVASSSDNLIIGNWVYDVGDWAHPNGDDGRHCAKIHGIYPSGEGDVAVNNIAFHNLGSGILFNHGAGHATMANNLSFNNGNHGISIDAGDGSGDNFVITNNIVLDNAMYGINVHASADGAHNQYRNNLFNGNGKGTYGLDNSAPPKNWPPNTPGTLTGDPGLVGYRKDGTGDYHLTAQSPCVDTGTTLGAPDTDYDGVPRPQGGGYDIGPYELPTGTTTTTPTTTTPTTPTTTPPTPTSTSTTPPGTVTAGFEDGTTQGWSGLYGNAQPRVITDVAYEGSHALRFNQATGGHSAAGTSRQLAALHPGSTVTYHVRADQGGVTVRPFVRDSQYHPVMAGTDVTLPAQRWTTITWQVPTVTSVATIGLDAGPGGGTVVLDALSWPTS